MKKSNFVPQGVGVESTRALVPGAVVTVVPTVISVRQGQGGGQEQALPQGSQQWKEQQESS